MLARILLTLTVLGYSLGTIRADFNKTHATNPAWTPHARFHVVWQILSYSGVGLIALYLIWLGSGGIESLWLATALSFVVYAAFFSAVFSRPVYQGSLFDANGYPSFRPPIGPEHWRWDVNVTVFAILSTILFAAVAALLAS
jgi:hypothetical protein